MDESELKKARFYALKVINFRPRSSKELTNKLQDKGFPQKIISEVLAEFKKNGLVDDKKFSKLWINSRMASKPKGEILLREELRQKGVEDNVIKEAIEDTNKDKGEYEVVKELADARMAALRDLDKKTAKRRLFGYLKRRGFSFETIMRVLKEEF